VMQKIIQQAFRNPFRETFFRHHILLAVRLHSCGDRNEVDECYEEDGKRVNMNMGRTYCNIITLRRGKSRTRSTSTSMRMSENRVRLSVE
jgi:hypothetical protein